MKVKFNLPSKRYTNNFSFDNNTTLGIGSVQPLFCKSLVAGSKVSIGYSQLTRLSALFCAILSASRCLFSSSQDILFFSPSLLS